MISWRQFHGGLPHRRYHMMFVFVIVVETVIRGTGYLVNITAMMTPWVEMVITHIMEDSVNATNKKGGRDG